MKLDAQNYHLLTTLSLGCADTAVAPVTWKCSKLLLRKNHELIKWDKMTVVRAVSHWRLFQFCQAYTRTIQKNGESHWTCMVANERSGNQLCQPNWQDFANKIYLVCCKPFGGWQDRRRSTCTLGRHLACELKRQCSIKRL